MRSARTTERGERGDSVRASPSTSSLRDSCSAPSPANARRDGRSGLQAEGNGTAPEARHQSGQDPGAELYPRPLQMDGGPSHPRPGDFYARVPATSTCRGDNSKTLHVSKRPNTKIIHASVTHGRNVIFKYRGLSGIPPYNFQCKLDDKPYRHCPELEKRYVGLSHGHHVFRVRARGDNGKQDRTPDKRGFRIQPRRPAPRFCLARKAEVPVHTFGSKRRYCVGDVGGERGDRASKYRRV